MASGKARLFDLQAQICKTLADANRVLILHELRPGERSVSQLAASLGLPQSNVSHHLAILRENAIVLTRRGYNQVLPVGRREDSNSVRPRERSGAGKSYSRRRSGPLFGVFGQGLDGTRLKLSRGINPAVWHMRSCNE